MFLWCSQFDLEFTASTAITERHAQNNVMSGCNIITKKRHLMFDSCRVCRESDIRAR